MKKVIGILFLSLIMVLTITISINKERMPIQMPNDFNFIIAYGYNAKNKIDTFKGEYTKDLVEDGSATCKIKFTEDEMRKIYEEMKKIDIVNYPRQFTPPYRDNPKSGIEAEATSYSTYYFIIQIDGKVKEINWVDKNLSQASDVKQLHELIRRVMEIVEDKDEYKKLPPQNGAYL